MTNKSTLMMREYDAKRKAQGDSRVHAWLPKELAEKLEHIKKVHKLKNFAAAIRECIQEY
jgi:hypothetical protein